MVQVQKMFGLKKQRRLVSCSFAGTKVKKDIGIPVFINEYAARRHLKK
jgi:hypothetical protein